MEKRVLFQDMKMHFQQENEFDTVSTFSQIRFEHNYVRFSDISRNTHKYHTTIYKQDVLLGTDCIALWSRFEGFF